MSDIINDSDTTEEATYPTPEKVYVKRGRCIYCGSKKIQRLWGYDWCDKPCNMGKLVLDKYECQHHLGKYSKSTINIIDESDNI